MNQARQRKRASASKCPALDRAREHYGQRAWADAYQAFLLAEQETPLAAEDLELLAMAAYLTGRDDDYLTALERAYHAHLRCRPVRPRRPLRVLARLSPAHARRDGPRDRLACPCSAVAGSRCARVRRARLSAAAGGRAAPRIGRLRGRLRRCSRGRRDRRALRRRGSGRLRPPSAGPDSTAARAGRSRARAPGRDHGRGHGGRAVAPRDGPDVLQRDRGLPAGLCARPHPRVDGRPDAMVRGPARHGRLRRRLPGASRGDHAAAGRLAGGDRGGATRLRAFAGHRPAGHRRGVLPAGGGPSSEGRVRGGRGGVSRAPASSGLEPQPGLALLRLAQGRIRRGRHRHSLASRARRRTG